MADIFVSYASPDRDVAFRIVAFLEQHGISCWVAPRDVPPGVEYGQAIIDGIGESRALVLILSDQANESQFVKKEVERASARPSGLPVRIGRAPRLVSLIPGAMGDAGKSRWSRICCR